MDSSLPTVCILDDEDGVRRSLSRLVRAAGWNPQTFSSAREFMARPPSSEAVCLLLDVWMPDLTGPQLQEWMIDKGILLPVIFLTAHSDVPTSVQAMKQGAVDFLLKPVDAELLQKTISHCITMRAAVNSRDAQQQEIKGRYSRLTAREREVMKHVIIGRLNKQIAADLGISLKTVKVHRARAMEKMEVSSVAALVHTCESAGITS
jgi:FixJ family two-component response regulator